MDGVLLAKNRAVLLTGLEVHVSAADYVTLDTRPPPRGTCRNDPLVFPCNGVSLFSSPLPA